MRLTPTAANAIIAGGFAAGSAAGMTPLTVAVLDAGGHVVALQRVDGASILRPAIAIAKAAGALALGVSSRTIAEMAVERPAFLAALGALAPPASSRRRAA